MAKQDRIPGRFVRLLDCTAIGLAMALTAYLCAWYSMRTHYGYRRPHQRVFATLGNLSKALDEYCNKNGNYPEKLADLKRTHPDAVRLEDSGQVVDPWSHPYQYRAEGDHYTCSRSAAMASAAARDLIKIWLQPTFSLTTTAFFGCRRSVSPPFGNSRPNRARAA